MPLTLDEIVSEVETAVAHGRLEPNRAADSWHKLFTYHEEGYLIWKVSPGQTPLQNKKAGWEDKEYNRVKVGYKSYAVHRIIWEMFNGVIPEGKEIDHIDRDKRNNKIANLRVVDRVQNCQNRPRRADNKSGVPGVWWSKQKNAWIAYLSVNKKLKYLGKFHSFLDAKKARENAIKEYGYITNKF